MSEIQLNFIQAENIDFIGFFIPDPNDISIPLDLKSIPRCKDYEWYSGYFDKAHGAFIRKYEYKKPMGSTYMIFSFFLIVLFFNKIVFSEFNSTVKFSGIIRFSFISRVFCFGVNTFPFILK